MAHRLRRRKRAPKARQNDRDWLFYLERIVDEMVVAIEILRRLRWARELVAKGVAVAPKPAGRYHVREIQGEWSKLVKQLLTPEQMARKIPAADLSRLQDEWEFEIREWGRPIWEKRDHTLRLRKKRADLRRSLEGLQSFAHISKAEALALHNDMAAEPGKWHRSKSGVRAVHFAVPRDAFGNETDEILTEQENAEMAEPPEDERAARRLIRGHLKKSRGGIHDLDPRLVRGGKVPIE